MRWFLDISTRSKLIAGFGSLVLLLLVVAATSYKGITTIQTSQRSLYEREVADETDLREIRAHQTSVRADVAIMFFMASKPEMDALHLGIKAHSDHTEELMLQILERSQRLPRRLVKVQEFDLLRKAYRDTRETQVIPLIYAGKADEAKRVFLTTQGQRNARMQVIADELVDETEQLARQALAQSEQTARDSMTLFGILSVIAVVLGIGLTAFLTRVMADPLKQLATAAERVAAGDLSVSLPAETRTDETGILTQTFRQMVVNLREVMREINEGVNVLASSASEITAATTQVAAGSAETAAAVSQTTTTVEEVKQTAQMSVQKARYVSEAAQKSVQISQGGKKSMDESIEAMYRIQEQMESIGNSIVRLSEQSQAIGEIIATVNDLAEQSNLLAVNAAIEAAKAGDQGRGFAVVAQEVKSMAEQSKQATAQVRALLSDIQKATGRAVMATEQGSKAVEVGVRLSANVDESIRLLAESIAESAQAAMQIAASAQQQLVGMDQVVLAMQNINQASSQNAASTRQAETAAQGLHGLGQKLKQLIVQYRV